MASSPINSSQIDGETMETVRDFILRVSKITAAGDWSHEIKRGLLLGIKVMINIDSVLKKQRHYFADKGPSSQSYGFSNSHVWMWEWDHKEGWVPENWCFWPVVLEKTLESLLDCKEIKPVNTKGNQYWIFIRTNTEGEAPILWPPDATNWLIGKDPDAGKDWRQEEKRTTENEMVGWHRWLNRHWVGSGSWWRTGKPGVLQSMVSQSWTQLNDWTELGHFRLPNSMMPLSSRVALCLGQVLQFSAFCLCPKPENSGNTGYRLFSHFSTVNPSLESDSL